MNKLQVRSIPGYRMGTVAQQPIRQGELYISVPEALLIGPERYQSGTPFDRLLGLVQQNSTADLSRILDSKSLLIIFILLEKHMIPDSLWRPYFDLLPQNLTMPMFFTHQQLLALQGSEVADAGREERRRARATYQGVREHVFRARRDLFPRRRFTQAEWLWASGLYDSRVIQLNRHTGRGNVPTFIPLIDMVNCRESHDQTFITFNPETRTAEMRADADFAVGEQVFETYGNKSNYEYLLYNGFVMADNPNDCVYITFPAQPSHQRDPNRPMRPLRTCLGTRELPTAVKQWGLAMEVMHRAPGEGRRFLMDYIQQKLDKYATSVEEDDALLAKMSARGDEADPHMTLAVQMRRHEKATLLAVMAKLRSGEWPCCSSV